MIFFYRLTYEPHFKMKGLNPHSKILQKSRDLAEMNKYDNLQSTLFRNFGKLLSFQLTMTAFFILLKYIKGTEVSC